MKKEAFEWHLTNYFASYEEGRRFILQHVRLFEVSVKISCVHWIFRRAVCGGLECNWPSVKLFFCGGWNQRRKSYQELDIVCFYKSAALFTCEFLCEGNRLCLAFVWRDCTGPSHVPLKDYIDPPTEDELLVSVLYRAEQDPGGVCAPKAVFVLFFCWELKLITGFRRLGISRGCGGVFLCR